MIMGPRPTLGWLGYLMLGGSWYRLALLMVAFSLVSLLILEESQKVVTLQHSSPMPFPPPVIFVHTPDNTYLTPLDACAVEAATGGLKQPSVKRRVYVYLWASSVTSSDVWAKWILQLPNVNVVSMDLPRLVSRTEIASLKKADGMETWRRWLAARLALLWISGGLVMPFGTIMVKPLAVETVGAYAGLLLEEDDGLLDPILLATPSHHRITSFMAKYLLNNSEIVQTTMNSPNVLLTEAVKEGCGIDRLLYLPDSDCSRFKVFSKDEVVHLKDQEEDTVPEPKETVLLRYLTEPYSYLDDDRFQKLFQTNQLKRFCPFTARNLELRLQATNNL